MAETTSNTETTILVVEDDGAIRLGLEDTLRAKGYEVLSTSSGTEAVDLVRRRGPDLVLLDVMLPDQDGFEVCRQIQALDDRPGVIMLTARSAELDRVRGLELGADDYITKPFSLMELLARIGAVLRRLGDGAPAGGASDTGGARRRKGPDRVRIGDAVVDFRRHEAWRKGESVALSDRAFLVLEVLARHRGEVVSRDELLEDAWGYGKGLNTRTVDNHVVKIRQAIEPDPEHPRHLLTVWGVGYKLSDREEAP